MSIKRTIYGPSQNATSVADGSITPAKLDGGATTPDSTKYYRGDGSWQTPAGGAVTSVAGKTGAVSLVKGDVGLGNVDNTADSAKPVSTAQQAALDAKAPLASPTFTGTPAAPTVAGTSDSTTKLATTAFVQAVAALLAPKASPALTGSPTAPTQTPGDSSTKLATTAFVAAALGLTQTTKTTAYTLVLADANTLVEGNSASALTFTVPPNSSVAFPVGTVVSLRQYGAGQVTVAAGSGVTIRSRGGALKLAGQYAEAALTKRATDEWVLSGDITT